MAPMSESSELKEQKVPLYMLDMTFTREEISVISYQHSDPLVFILEIDEQSIRKNQGG